MRATLGASMALLMAGCGAARTTQPSAPSPATPSDERTATATASPESGDSALTASAGPLSADQATSAIARMVTREVPTAFAVKAVSDEVNGWIAVALDPPYREFPNVVLFRRTGAAWQRVWEGLSIGIQPYTSPYLDLQRRR